MKIKRITIIMVLCFAFIVSTIATPKAITNYTIVSSNSSFSVKVGNVFKNRNDSLPYVYAKNKSTGKSVPGYQACSNFKIVSNNPKVATCSYGVDPINYLVCSQDPGVYLTIKGVSKGNTNITVTYTTPDRYTIKTTIPVVVS